MGSICCNVLYCTPSWNSTIWENHKIFSPVRNFISRLFLLCTQYVKLSRLHCSGSCKASRFTRSNANSTIQKKIRYKRFDVCTLSFSRLVKSVCLLIHTFLLLYKSVVWPKRVSRMREKTFCCSHSEKNGDNLYTRWVISVHQQYVKWPNMICETLEELLNLFELEYLSADHNPDATANPARKRSILRGVG